MTSKVIKVVLFTNKTCSLCDKARHALSQASTVLRPQILDVTEINIQEPQHKKWNAIYCFDVPVIHFADGKSKLMHHIYQDDILTKIKQIKAGKYETTLGINRGTLGI